MSLRVGTQHRRRLVRFSVLAIIIALAGAGASAQELNIRTQASPEADAKMDRLITRSATEAAGSNGLLPQDIINNTCGPLEIGNTPSNKTNALNQDNTVVVRGNVVNICH